ncbi:MAG: hypothetical protein WEC36_06535, partial [Phycisphaeraceae bacterium]
MPRNAANLVLIIIVSVIALAIGVAVGAGIMWFRVVPALAGAMGVPGSPGGAPRNRAPTRPPPAMVSFGQVQQQ